MARAGALVAVLAGLGVGDPARADAPDTWFGGFYGAGAEAMAAAAPLAAAPRLPMASPIPPPMAGSTAVASGGPCGPAIAAASGAFALPAGILGAIAVVESGRADPVSGDIVPWPWTIDANGQGHFYASKAQAVQAARNFLAAGVVSLDLGCLQVNIHQHPDAFANLDAAFDPATNAAYAARFLSALHGQTGDWAAAVADYHSLTPALGQPYAASVLAAWRRGGAAEAFASPTGAHPLGPVAGPVGAPIGGFAFRDTIARPIGVAFSPTARGLAAYRAAPIPIARSLPTG